MKTVLRYALLNFAAMLLALSSGCAGARKASHASGAADSLHSAISLEVVGMGFRGSHGVSEWGAQVAVANTYGEAPCIGVVGGADTPPRVVAMKGFSGPAGLAAAPERGLLACDVKGNRVVLLDSAGATTDSIQVPAPWNLARLPSPEGDALFAVIHFRGEMTLLRVREGRLEPGALLPAVGEFPFGIAWHPGRRELLVTMQAEGRVLGLPFDPDTPIRPMKPHVLLDGLINPEGIAVDATGNIWVAETAEHRVAVFDASGERIGVTPPGALRFPVSLSAGRDNTVLVGCGGDSGRVVRACWSAPGASALAAPGL